MMQVRVEEEIVVLCLLIGVEAVSMAGESVVPYLIKVKVGLW
jgi:hypothetical protein